HSLQALAHGSDGVMFFQWRQARYGPEKFHSAMLPHGGTDTRQWRETLALGADVRRLAEVAGTTTRAEVALVMDWDSWWGLEAPESLPSNRLRLHALLMSWYAPLHARGIDVDLAPPGRDLSSYKVVIVPNLYLCTAEQAANLASFTGRLVVGPFSGVVDAADQVHDGGAPGPLRPLLGVRSEEPWPIPDGRTQELVAHDGTRLVARTWSEWLEVDDAQVLARYRGGPLDGRPAVTRRGAATYLSCVPDDLTPVLDEVLGDAGITAPVLPEGVEACRRGDFLFLLNHGAAEATVPLPAAGTDLLTGRRLHGSVALAPRDAVVLKYRVS
ncbi:beta-galactosidase, partial [Streptomyces sp. 12297]